MQYDEFARAVISVVRDSVTEGELQDVLAQLPEEYHALFESGSEGEMQSQAGEGEEVRPSDTTIGVYRGRCPTSFAESQGQTSNTIQTLANQVQPGLQLDPSSVWCRAVLQSNMCVHQF